MEKQQQQNREKGVLVRNFSRWCWQFTYTDVPIEKLQGHSVPIVMRQQIDSLVAQTQVSHQGLHHSGLLKNGVLVGSLEWPDAAENEL